MYIYIYIYICDIILWEYLDASPSWHIKLSMMRFASPAMVTSHVTGLVEPSMAFPIISCSNGLVLGVFATVNVYEM